jgi:phenylpropionate dioxygenase-like ring-hydroxylating dioxygenase large terminal subunit
VYALLDRCPHRGGPLSQGIVHGDCVTCPLHDWVVELPSGSARAPDEGAVETFPVRVENGHVLVEVAEAPMQETGACDTRAAAAARAQGGARVCAVPGGEARPPAADGAAHAVRRA